MKKWFFYIGLTLFSFSAGWCFTGCATEMRHLSDGMLKGDSYIKSKIIWEIIALESQNKSKTIIKYNDASKILERHFTLGMDKEQVISILKKDDLRYHEEGNKFFIYCQYGLYRLITINFFFDSQNKLIGFDGTYIVISEL